MKLNRKNLLLASSAVITVAFSTPAAHAAGGTWNVDASDNWSTAANWSPVAIPGTTAGDIIGLTNNITADSTVTIDTTSRTAAILNIGDSDDSHAFTLAASGAATLTLDNSGSGAQINETGSLADTISGPIILAENLVVDTAGLLKISGNISGSGTLTKLGGNDTVLTLSGNNGYSGGTSLTGGQIIASHANALGGTNVTINGGRRLAIDAGLNVANNITISSATGEVGRGVLESRGSGTATLSGNISVTGGIAAGGHFTSTTGNDLVLSGVITSTAGLSQRAGTVTYSGGGTGYGNLGITGTAKVGAENGIATTGNLTIGANGNSFLDLNGYNQSLVGITKGAQDATIGSSSATANSILTTTGTSTYAGTIVDVIPLSGGNKTLALTVASGTLTLSGENTYTGATTITAGTLALGNVNALGTIPGTNGTSGIAMASTGILQSSTAGTNPSTTIAASITLSGLGDATLRIGQGASSNTHTFNLNGAIGGTTGNLVFTTTAASFNNGGSVFVLGAAGNYAGNTLITTGNGGNNPVTVRAGTGVVNALPATTVLTFDQVTGGGTGRALTYNMNGNAQTLVGLSNGGSVPQLRNHTFTNSGTLATLTINNAADFTFGGSYLNTANSATTRAQITGAIALTKNGAGTFTLGGSLVNGATAGGNTFTGNTTILGGILVLGETISLQNSALDTASSAAGDGTNGLRVGIDGTGVTALTLGGLIGNKNLANVFTTTTGGYTGLTALTLNPGTGAIQSYSGDIGNGNGSMTLTKTGAGTQILFGANTYTGTTTISAGILQFTKTTSLYSNPASWTAANIKVANTATFALNVGGTNEFTTANVTTLLTALGGTNGTTTTGFAAGSTIGFDTSNASGGSFTIANSITDSSGIGGGAIGLTKLGTGTLALSGLSTMAANNYTGTTTIDQGTLAFTTTNPSLTGGLTFGSAPIVTTAGILDLSSASATFGGTLLVNTNSATASEIKIGSAQTLTVNDTVQIGATTPVVADSINKLGMTGGGTFNVAGATFAVGGSSSTTRSQFTTLDLTALSATNINLTGNFRISPNTGTNIGGDAKMLLPTPAVADTVATTNITVATGSTFTVGGGGSFNNASQMNSITLGTGLTTFNADNINVGTGGRDLGQIVYGQPAGDLILRAADGINRATAINVGSLGGGTGSFGLPILVDFSGHDADIVVTSINVGNQARTGTQSYEFNFGKGDQVSRASKLDATNVNIGFRGANASATNTLTSKVNLSGGTVTFGNVGATGTGVDIGSSLYVSAGVAATVGELNISGGNVTIHNSSSLGSAVRLGTNQETGGGTVAAFLNITGGATTLGGDIIRNATSPRTTSTVKISGGTLNMGGKKIGTSLTEPITLTAESGTLQNVESINGTGGLTKTTAGTLVVSGTNTYTGDTTVSEGTLTLGANNALPANPVSIGTATLDAASFDDTLGTLDPTSNAVINLGTGANLVFANSSEIDWTGGTLNITGTFVSGSSLNFGPGGLLPAQLALISVNGAGAGTFSLNPAGFLIGTAVSNYATWAASQMPPVTGGENGDSDNDGVNNLVEYALVNGGERGVLSGNTITFTKRGAPYGSDLTYIIETSETLASGSWMVAVTHGPGLLISNPAISYTFTPSTPVKKFARLKVITTP